MTTKGIRPKEVVLGQLLEGINQSAGAAGLLTHHQQNVQWMKIRMILESIKGLIIAQSVEPLMKPKKPGRI